MKKNKSAYSIKLLMAATIFVSSTRVYAIDLNTKIQNTDKSFFNTINSPYKVNNGNFFSAEMSQTANPLVLKKSDGSVVPLIQGLNVLELSFLFGMTDWLQLGILVPGERPYGIVGPYADAKQYLGNILIEPKVYLMDGVAIIPLYYLPSSSSVDTEINGQKTNVPLGKPKGGYGAKLAVGFGDPRKNDILTAFQVGAIMAPESKFREIDQSNRFQLNAGMSVPLSGTLRLLVEAYAEKTKNNTPLETLASIEYKNDAFLLRIGGGKDLSSTGGSNTSRVLANFSYYFGDKKAVETEMLGSPVRKTPEKIDERFENLEKNKDKKNPNRQNDPIEEQNGPNVSLDPNGVFANNEFIIKPRQVQLEKASVPKQKKTPTPVAQDVFMYAERRKSKEEMMVLGDADDQPSRRPASLSGLDTEEISSSSSTSRSLTNLTQAIQLMDYNIFLYQLASRSNKVESMNRLKTELRWGVRVYTKNLKKLQDLKQDPSIPSQIDLAQSILAGDEVSFPADNIQVVVAEAKLNARSAPTTKARNVILRLNKLEKVLILGKAIYGDFVQIQVLGKNPPNIPLFVSAKYLSSPELATTIIVGKKEEELIDQGSKQESQKVETSKNTEVGYEELYPVQKTFRSLILANDDENHPINYKPEIRKIEQTGTTNTVLETKPIGEELVTSSPSYKVIDPLSEEEKSKIEQAKSVSATIKDNDQVNNLINSTYGNLSNALADKNHAINQPVSVSTLNKEYALLTENSELKTIGEELTTVSPSYKVIDPLTLEEKKEIELNKIASKKDQETKDVNSLINSNYENVISALANENSSINQPIIISKLDKEEARVSVTEMKDVGSELTTVSPNYKVVDPLTAEEKAQIESNKLVEQKLKNEKDTRLALENSYSSVISALQDDSHAINQKFEVSKTKEELTSVSAPLETKEIGEELVTVNPPEPSILAGQDSLLLGQSTTLSSIDESVPKYQAPKKEVIKEIVVVAAPLIETEVMPVIVLDKTAPLIASNPVIEIAPVEKTVAIPKETIKEVLNQELNSFDKKVEDKKIKKTQNSSDPLMNLINESESSEKNEGSKSTPKTRMAASEEKTFELDSQKESQALPQKGEVLNPSPEGQEPVAPIKKDLPSADMSNIETVTLKDNSKVKVDESSKLEVVSPKQGWTPEVIVVPSNPTETQLKEESKVQVVEKKSAPAPIKGKDSVESKIEVSDSQKESTKEALLKEEKLDVVDVKEANKEESLNLLKDSSDQETSLKQAEKTLDEKKKSEAKIAAEKLAKEQAQLEALRKAKIRELKKLDEMIKSKLDTPTSVLVERSEGDKKEVINKVDETTSPNKSFKLYEQDPIEEQKGPSFDDL